MDISIFIQGFFILNNDLSSRQWAPMAHFAVLGRSWRNEFVKFFLNRMLAFFILRLEYASNFCWAHANHSKPISLPPAGGGPSAHEGVGGQISSWEGGFPPLPHSLVDTSYWSTFLLGLWKGPLSLSLSVYHNISACRRQKLFGLYCFERAPSASLSVHHNISACRRQKFLGFERPPSASLLHSSQYYKCLPQAEIFWL